LVDFLGSGKGVSGIALVAGEDETGDLAKMFIVEILG